MYNNNNFILSACVIEERAGSNHQGVYCTARDAPWALMEQMSACIHRAGTALDSRCPCQMPGFPIKRRQGTSSRTESGYDPLLGVPIVQCLGTDIMMRCFD